MYFLYGYVLSMGVGKRKKEIEQLASKLGMCLVSAETTRGSHLVLTLEYKTQRFRYFTAATLSDKQRGARNMEGDLHRAVRDIDEGRAPWLVKTNYRKG